MRASGTINEKWVVEEDFRFICGRQILCTALRWRFVVGCYLYHYRRPQFPMHSRCSGPVATSRPAHRVGARCLCGGSMSMSSLGGLSRSTSRCPCTCIAGRVRPPGAVRCGALRCGKHTLLTLIGSVGSVGFGCCCIASSLISSAAIYPSSGGSRLGEAAEASSGELELVASAAAAAAADFSASLAQ